MLTQEARDDLILRLRKIEGQAQGIQRMLADGRDCREVLNQLASVRAATQRASLELMKYYALTSLTNPQGNAEETVDGLISLMLRVEGAEIHGDIGDSVTRPDHSWGVRTLVDSKPVGAAQAGHPHLSLTRLWRGGTTPKVAREVSGITRRSHKDAGNHPHPFCLP